MMGDELRALRVEAGYKSKELAAVLGVTATTMSRYECDRLPIPRLVQYATRYVCEQQNAKSAPPPVPSVGDRLVSALREALSDEDTGQR